MSNEIACFDATATHSLSLFANVGSTHPTKPKTWQWQWQTHSLYLGRGSLGLEHKNEWQGERKGNAHHHQIQSTQLKPNHHITIKQSNAKKRKQIKAVSFNKKNTHTQLLSSPSL
jgi:hypothetical protein